MAELTRGELSGIFIWGAVGGALPTIGKIAGTYGANFDAPLPNLVGVVIALALYATIGAIISRAIGNPDMKQSLFAGIAAPAIVVSVLSGATDSKGLRPTQQGAIFEVITPAHAQAQKKATKRKPTRPIDDIPDSFTALISPKIEGTYPISGRVVVRVDGRSAEEITTIDASKPEDDLVLLPTFEGSGATLIFTSSNGVTAKLAVPQEELIVVEVRLIPKTSFGKDLAWALGAGRTLEIAEIRPSISR